MQTEWASGRNDEQVGGLTPGAAPAPPAVEDDMAVPLVDAVIGSDVDPVPASDAVTDSGVAEEEAHRSAVDAVDGLLDEVELAMARLDDGTYGRCETCGVPIDDAQLSGEPLVRECTPCSTGALALEGV